MNRENEYMREALKEAYKAKKIDEVPIGAVVVRNGEFIARAHNMKEHDQLASSHAEHLALTKAQKILGTWNLQDCDLYVTLEPCMMCTGLIQLSRIRRLYYGTSDPKGGCLETVIHVKQIPHLNTYPKEIYADIMKEECSEILTTFFKEKISIKTIHKPELEVRFFVIIISAGDIHGKNSTISKISFLNIRRSCRTGIYC